MTSCKLFLLLLFCSLTKRLVKQLHKDVIQTRLYTKRLAHICSIGRQDVPLSHLWNQVLETGDDVGALEFLVVAKAAGYDDHGDESYG